MKNLYVKIILFTSLFVFCVGGPIIEGNSSKDLKAEKSIAPKKPEESSGITEEERKFLREIEAKFNIQSDDDDLDDDSEEEDSSKEKVIRKDKDGKEDVSQVPFPAVIAIEIVDDNSTDSKGKRTIDADLGYGYKTNDGYVYNHFGKSETRGKFMIYPYSQHDIPPPKKFKYHTQVLYNKDKGEKTTVEILPSKAYQLIPVNQYEPEHHSYGTDGLVSQIRTKYENVHAIQTPPPIQYQTHESAYQDPSPTPVYNTYHSGHDNIPVINPNYYVNPPRYVHQPQHQDYAYDNQEQVVPQKAIIPILILRIPSSQLQNPTAEFFPKVSHDNPFAAALNQIDLQSLVNQYLTSLNHQYEEPAPTVDPNIVKYNQPIHYYDQQLYTGPTAESLQYVQNGPQQYIHQEQEDQQVKYILPNPSPTPETHQQLVHAEYGQKIQPAPTYENNEEDNLPFSENYPSPLHTQVIYNPHVQQMTTHNVVPSQIVNTYPNTRSKIPRYAPPNKPTVTHKYSSVIPASSPHKEEVTKTLATIAPYNYHAHPNPKRQIKVMETTTKKSTHPKRRLITDTKTLP